jgi:hypothetical protein
LQGIACTDHVKSKEKSLMTAAVMTSPAEKAIDWSRLVALFMGAAPNSIAYDSKQFTSGEFFMYGIPASIILRIVVGLATAVLWPMMGMPVTVPR